VFLFDTKGLEKDKVGCNWCELAKFSTHSDYPVTVTNNVDKATFPEGFHFIEHSILREGVARADAGRRRLRVSGMLLHSGYGGKDKQTGPTKESERVSVERAKCRLFAEGYP
jgi:hypothetical protein